MHAVSPVSHRSGSISRSRWPRSLTIALLSVLIAATVLPLAAASHASEDLDVVGGTLDWGVRDSFIGYVEGPAQGQIALDEVERNEDGTFRFPGGTGTAREGDLDVAFHGAIAFTGHYIGGDPLLDLTISSPAVRVDGETVVLTADVRSQDIDEPGQYLEQSQVAIAVLDLAAADLTESAQTRTLADIPASLTDEGAAAFGGLYDAGDALDPLTIALDLAPIDTPPAGSEAQIEVDQVTGLENGQALTVTGSGFDPAGNLGARPPLAGQPGGVYVAFARIDEPWAPSAGAPSSARQIIEQRWALPEASRAVIPGGDTVLMEADGSFVATLEARTDLEAETALPDGQYAVIVYPGSGAVNPDEELAVTVQFGTPDDSGDPDEPGDRDPDDADDPEDNGDGSGNDDGDRDEDDDPTDNDDGSGNDDDADDGTRTGVITDGVLDWGIKHSFTTYIEGPIAGGEITTSEGAQRNPDATFRFVSPSGQVDDDGLDAAFDGAVQFTGHRHGGPDPLLNLTIASPTVTIDGDVGTLSADVRSRSLEDPDHYLEGEQIVIATLDLSALELGTTQVRTTDDGVLQATDVPSDLATDGVLTAEGIVPTLTAEGAEAFVGFYEPGDELDPLHLTLILDDADATLPPPPSGTTDPVDETDPGAPFAPTVPSTPSSAPTLPRTGNDTTALLAFGLLAVGVGVTAMLWTRRQTGQASTAGPRDS